VSEKGFSVSPGKERWSDKESKHSWLFAVLVAVLARGNMLREEKGLKMGMRGWMATYVC
jgi:hypothetical protein